MIRQLNVSTLNVSTLNVSTLNVSTLRTRFIHVHVSPEVTANVIAVPKANMPPAYLWTMKTSLHTPPRTRQYTSITNHNMNIFQIKSINPPFNLQISQLKRNHNIIMISATKTDKLFALRHTHGTICHKQGEVCMFQGSMFCVWPLAFQQRGGVGPFIFL